jgi:hypothetical protein
MKTQPLSADDQLLARLQAPPDLDDGLESLLYWRGRRERLSWYRRRARREAAQMTAVWERRVRAALLHQRAVPFAMRLEGARLIATGVMTRWRRSWVRLAVATLVVLTLAPVLALDLVLKAL